MAMRTAAMPVAAPARKRGAIETAVPEVKTDRDGLIKCRVCGCTEREACNPPCGWQPGELDLCTSCADAIWELRAWLERAHRPSMRALVREVLPPRALAMAQKAGGR